MAPTPVATNGRLHLTADPEYDPHFPLQLRYVLGNESPAAESDSFPAETAIFLDRSLPAGPVRVIANDKECRGTVRIEADLEVDAVLSVVDGVCTISTTEPHAMGAIAHPEPRTALGAFVVIDSILVVTPLDAANAIEPIRKPADEHAEVLDFEVPPGRYQLSVLVGGAVLTTMDIDLKRGQEFYYNLRVLVATVPRDCGSIPALTCEAAIAAAYANGLFPTLSAQRLEAVHVRPARSAGCYEPPVFDVLFDVRGEPQPIEVTVATTAGGNLSVCTY